MKYTFNIIKKDLSTLSSYTAPFLKIDKVASFTERFTEFSHSLMGASSLTRMMTLQKTAAAQSTSSVFKVTIEMLPDLKILGLDAQVGQMLSIKELKTLYKKSILTTHPDHNQQSNAQELFIAVQSAFKNLKHKIQSTEKHLDDNSYLSRELRDYFANINQELDLIDLDFQEITYGIHRVDLKLETLNDDVKLTKKHIAQFEDNLAECQEIVVGNRQQVTRFAAKVDDLAASVEHFSASADQFSASADQFSASADHFSASADHFSASVDQFSASADHFSASVDQCSIHLSELTTNMENLTIKINSAIAQSEANEVIIKQNAQVTSQIKTDMCQLMRELGIELPDELKSTGIASSRFAFMPPPLIKQGACALDEELPADLVV